MWRHVMRRSMQNFSSPKLLWPRSASCGHSSTANFSTDWPFFRKNSREGGWVILFLTLVRSKATLWEGPCQISAFQHDFSLDQPLRRHFRIAHYNHFGLILEPDQDIFGIWDHFQRFQHLRNKKISKYEKKFRPLRDSNHRVPEPRLGAEVCRKSLLCSAFIHWATAPLIRERFERLLKAYLKGLFVGVK